MEDCYQEYVDLIKDASDHGLTCVLVFKPAALVDHVTMPDMILSTTSDPAVIDALLGAEESDD